MFRYSTKWRDLEDLRLRLAHLNNVADLLAHQRLRQRGNVGEAACAWVRLILAHNPIALAASIIARDCHRAAEMDPGGIVCGTHQLGG